MSTASTDPKTKANGAAETRKIMITDRHTVIADRLCKYGDVVEVPAALANRLVWHNRAIPAHTIKCRVIAPVFNGTANHAVGDEIEVEEAVALRLYENGAVTILEVSKLQADLPKVKKPAAPEPFDPFGAWRRIRSFVIAKSLVWGSKVFTKGDAIELPEWKAAEALAAHAIELAPGERLMEPDQQNQHVLHHPDASL